MASANTVRAGRAFVELLANNNALYRGLDQAKKRVQQWAGSISRLGLKLSVAGGAITAPLAKILSDFAGRGNEIGQLAERLGSSVESVSRLAYGFEQAGGSLDEFGRAAEGIAAKLSRMQDQEQFFGDELRGLTAGQLRGKGIDDQLDLIAEKFSTIRDAQDQARVAGELGLTGLLKYIRDGKAGMDRLRADVPKDGILGSDEAKRSEELVKAYNRAWLEVRTTFGQVAQALLPASESTRTLSEQVADLGGRVRAWIQDNGGLIVSVAAAGAGLIAGGVALGVFGKALSLAAVGLGVVTTALKLTGAAVALLLSPVGFVTAAVAGLGAAIVAHVGAGREAVGTLGGLFTGLGETAKESWGGIVAAVGSGDLALAGQIAMTGLKAAWAQVTAAMTDLWNQFKDVVVDGFREIRGRVTGLFVNDGAMAAKIAEMKAAARKLGLDPNAIGSAGEELTAEGRAARQARDRAARAADLAAAEAEVTALKDQLRDLGQRARDQAAAQQAAAAAPKKLLEAAPAPRLAQIQQQLRDQLPQLYAAAKGGFGGPVQAQFGYGDNIAKRQLDAAQNTAKNTAVLPALNQNVIQLNDAMRFGK
jgi:hypothetical protein